ncbi:hypothetical protein GCM10025867_04890 [Frondihabitans sucicola]|uniref:Asp23/Gls24 family envelope stress response protein n=1 Tax=Frondihabitans sucicola TaxID=1268041 RepID=A0ABN6XXZ0_9MICO|nr:hypothetical protein [Frondihabitans sucicola]BDZ48248.1 hypothetical protein GCM10025867_04890 [Frondihabitans sucicola]
MTEPHAAPGAQTAAADNGADAASSGWSSIPDSSAATLDHSVTAADVPGRGPVIPGHVSIAPRVLQKVGGAVVADTLVVDRRDVRVDARDDEGNLALRVSTPLNVPALTPGLVVQPGGVLGTVRSLQETVTRRLFEITGRAVSRVDVTVTGSHLEKTAGLR